MKLYYPSFATFSETFSTFSEPVSTFFNRPSTLLDASATLLGLLSAFPASPEDEEKGSA